MDYKAIRDDEYANLFAMRGWSVICNFSEPLKYWILKVGKTIVENIVGEYNWQKEFYSSGAVDAICYVCNERKLCIRRMMWNDFTNEEFIAFYCFKHYKEAMEGF